MGVHAQHRFLVALAALWFAAAPAAAQECRIALALGIDVSSSVDPDEYALQAGGLAAALRDPEVAAAFLAVPGAQVALHDLRVERAAPAGGGGGLGRDRGAADLDAVAARIEGGAGGSRATRRRSATR